MLEDNSVSYKYVARTLSFQCEKIARAVHIYTACTELKFFPEDEVLHNSRLFRSIRGKFNFHNRVLHISQSRISFQARDSDDSPCGVKIGTRNAKIVLI